MHRRWGRVCVTVPLPLAQVEHKIVRASHDAMAPTFPASRPTTDLIVVLNVPAVRRWRSRRGRSDRCNVDSMEIPGLFHFFKAGIFGISAQNLPL